MRNPFKARLAIAGLLACSGLSQTASAQGQISRVGTITSFYLSGGSNYAFRVYVSDNGANQLSDCTYGFAYMNTSYDNYQAISAFLLTNYVQHQRVSVSFIKDASGFCQLTDTNN